LLIVNITDCKKNNRSLIKKKFEEDSGRAAKNVVYRKECNFNAGIHFSLGYFRSRVGRQLAAVLAVYCQAVNA
jgi:hypothetical protein